MKYGRQRELAQIAEVSDALISYWLKGKRRLPDEACRKLAAHFKVEPGAFRFGSQEEIQSIIGSQTN